MVVFDDGVVVINHSNPLAFACFTLTLPSPATRTAMRSVSHPHSLFSYGRTLGAIAKIRAPRCDAQSVVLQLVVKKESERDFPNKEEGSEESRVLLWVLLEAPPHGPLAILYRVSDIAYSVFCLFLRHVDMQDTLHIRHIAVEEAD
jgi:hypothetical protein